MNHPLKIEESLESKRVRSVFSFHEERSSILGLNQGIRRIRFSLPAMNTKHKNIWMRRSMITRNPLFIIYFFAKESGM